MKRATPPELAGLTSAAWAGSRRPPTRTRAPQNLYPIAGLERELRRRLGDPRGRYRACADARRLAPAHITAGGRPARPVCHNGPVSSPESAFEIGTDGPS